MKDAFRRRARNEIKEIWTRNGLNVSTIDDSDVDKLSDLLKTEDEAYEARQKYMVGIRALAARKKAIGR